MQIVTFNVHGFADSQYRDNVYELILYFQNYLLQNQSIDAICLQEVSFHAKQMWQRLPDMCLSSVKAVTNCIFEFLNFQELIPTPFLCDSNRVQLKLNMEDEEMDTKQLEWLLQLRLQLPTEFILSHELMLYDSTRQQIFYKTQDFPKTESKFYVEWKPKHEKVHGIVYARQSNPFLNHNRFDSRKGVSPLDLICKALNMYYVVGCANRYYQTLCNAILTHHPPKRYGNYIAKDLDTEERAIVMVQFDSQLEYPISTIFNCHLDHRYEKYRVEQISKMESDFIKKQNVDSYILCGDFNSLTKSDYTLEYEARINQVREKGNWELAHYEVTDYMKQQLQCVDCYACFHEEFSNPSSCRFHTRIDYIYCKKQNNVECLQCEIDTSCDCSDHFACWATFAK